MRRLLNGKGGITTYTTYMPTIGHSWTTDKNHSRLTGQVREVYYMYYGYKIGINEKGKYELVKSDYVSSLDELPNDYIYVKEKFYKTFNTKSVQEKNRKSFTTTAIAHFLIAHFQNTIGFHSCDFFNFSKFSRIFFEVFENLSSFFIHPLSTS